MTEAGSVLVLNSLYQAVQVTGVRRAFRLFYAGRARAVAPDFASYDFDNWCDLPPRANDAVIRLLAREWGVPKSAITIARGATERRKFLHVAGDPDSLARKLEVIVRDRHETTE